MTSASADQPEPDAPKPAKVKVAAQAAASEPAPRFPIWTANGVLGSVLLDAADVVSAVYHPTKEIIRVTTKGGFLLQLATSRKKFAIWWGSK